jgi:nudix-type nucleoside diphosphatase (YffH/AdpP family)
MEIKKIETLFKKYYNIEEITIEHEGKTFTRECMNKDNAVAAVVHNIQTDKYIFVEQWRPANLNYLIEIVAGTIKEGEDPEECMIREIEEETGYYVDSINKIFGPVYMLPGSCNEQMTIFYCEVTDKIDNGGGLEDENEYITVHEIDTHDVVYKYYSGYFKDAKTMLGLSKIIMDEINN